jgi:hypothetical protein
MKVQCPACDDYQGVSDFDPDCGKFYTCQACGHQWSYADERVSAGGTEPLYRCPILEGMLAYEQEYAPGQYDPREYFTKSEMLLHLRSNQWDQGKREAWAATASPVEGAEQTPFVRSEMEGEDGK